MRIGDIRCSCSGEQRTDGLSVRSVEWDDLGFLEMDHPPKAYLSGWVANDLRESCCGYDDPAPVLQSRIENREDAAIIPLQRDQPTGVESDSIHATFPEFVRRLRADSTLLAQARSFAWSGPPVASKASFTMALNAAAFSSDFWTAC